MKLKRYVASILLLLGICLPSVLVAQRLTVDFRQAANDDRTSALGNVRWVQSVLQGNNARYYEGMSVPQRILLTGIPATLGNVHSLTFSYLATKGGKHAYDFLTSYSQALDAAAAIAGPGILVNLNECGPDFSPPSSLPAVCAALHSGPNAYTLNIPDALGTALGHNVASGAANYEARFGNRTIDIYGNAPIIFPSLAFNGYSGSRDLYAEYTFTWTSTANAILIEMGGHLALGVDVPGAGSGIACGIGLGAGSISGAPFHFRLSRLDGKAIGSRDNQILGNAIRIPVACDVSGPLVACAGGQNIYTFKNGGRGYTYSWSLSNNTSGATIIGSSTGQSVQVNAGPKSGGYDLTVSVNAGGQLLTCTTPVTVGAINVIASATPILCHGDASTVTVSAGGGTPPYTGTGNFSVQAGTHTFTVTDASGCTTSTTLTITQPLQQLSATAGVTGMSCTGGNPIVVVTATGGTPPYTGTGTFYPSAGMQTFLVTDANGCTTNASVNVPPPSPLAPSAAVTAAILCNGGNATVAVTATGGMPPYTGTGTFSVAAGTYTYTVTDANGCSATTSITVTEPPVLTASATATPLTCGVTQSTVTVTASGGTPPYTGTGQFSAPAGTHTYTVTDANGCTASVSVTIQGSSSQMNITVNATPILCHGGTSTVTVAVTGGTPPYTGAGTFTVPAGTYTYTVTDANGCSATSAPITITQPASALSVSASATPILCFGGNSTVTVIATGGTPPYTGTGTFSVPAGTYTYTVTDANGCSAASAPITITQPASQLLVTASATPILCNGGTSTVTVTATGGTPPYTGTGTFTVPAGTYTYTVTDANGCSAASAPISINQPASALLVGVNATPILCFGGNSTVTVTASGGTPPYTGTGTFSVPAGTYTYTVTDANGCSAASAPITITQPASALSVSASATPILCFGGNSTVTVTATGGTPPYTGTGTFSVPAGTYTYTVTDANGCSAASAPITITQPAAALTISASATPILCNGGTSTVTVTAAGGTAPYTGTGNFTVTAGTYSYTVTDANGCSSTSAPITVTEPPVLNASATATPIPCNGGNSTVTVTATGGTPAYTGTGNFSAPAGTHTYTVTDANGCAASVTITINAGSLITVTADATPILCNGGTSIVTVTATGGVSPYVGTGTFTRTAGTYTFIVTDANGCTGSATITITQPASPLAVAASATPIPCHGGNSTVTVTASGGTPPYTGIGTFSVPAGTYTYTVTDANGCTAVSAQLTITQPAAQLTVTASATPILCNGGTSTVTVTAAGGTPPYTGTGSYTVNAGTYTYTVTDANGCSASSAPITVTEPPLLTVSASATPILCNGGNSTVTVSAAGGTLPYVGTGTFSVPAGSHTYTVTDANGCAASVTINVNGPSQISVTANATPILCGGGTSTVVVTAVGGTPPFAGTGTYFRGAGTYTFTVTDANNCSASTTITITEPPVLQADVNATPILCNGQLSTISVTASGGTAPYSGTGNFSYHAGTYTFIVSDMNSCADTVTVTVTEPPVLTALANYNPILCNGGSTDVTVSAAGGTLPYTGLGIYSVGAGTHNFTVTDANGCTSVATVTITEPPLLVVSWSATSILCNGGDATISITAAGGTPPYDGIGSFVRPAGSYSFTVTDANNCAATIQVSITEPPPLNASAIPTPILCYGGTSTITVGGAGGTPPYTGAGTYIRPPGTYTFTVTDANGCWDTVTVVLTEPPQLAAHAGATPILCAGDNSTVTVTATGGTPGYSGTGTFTRTAGTYTFTVTDANGCAASISLTITEPPALTAGATSTPILCNGDSATVTVTATGGTPPYLGTGNFVRGAGSYTFVVTDANGCSTAVIHTVTEPPPMNASAIPTPILCFGGTSTISVGGAGGTPPYNGTGSFTRPAGTYTFIVSDANGCADTATVVLTEPPQLFAHAGATPILCAGDNSTVTVTATGGTPPYSGTGTFLRPAGSYTFTVSDANGCAAAISLTITEPPALTAGATATPIMCNGDSAVVTVTASGGTPPYSGLGNYTVVAGTYTYTVTDYNGCTTSTTITVVEPPTLVAAADAPPIPCAGGTTTITVSASGGTPPYNGVGTFNHGAGTYTFIVSDANGCADTTTITLIDPPPLTAAATAPPILCNGGETTVTVTAAGGTAPYFGIGNFNRGAGTWSFTVTDTRGCFATTTITITEPPLLEAFASAPPVNCGSDSAAVTVTASGGTPPYSGVGVFYRKPGTYTFFVSDANGCAASVTVTVVGPPELIAAATATPILCNGGVTTITVTASGGTPPYNGTGNFTQSAGTFTYVVTDARGCTDTVTIVVTQPPSLSVNCTISDCKNGVRTISPNPSGGTPPYTYLWLPGSYTSPTIDVPCSFSGTVTVRVRDANWNSNDPNNSSCEAFCTLTIMVKEGSGAEPATPSDAYALFENYPNPFNPSTTISYYLPEASTVRLTVHDMLGRTIAILVDEEKAAGSHQVGWNAVTDAGLPAQSGSYIYRIQAKSRTTDRVFSSEKLMMLLR